MNNKKKLKANTFEELLLDLLRTSKDEIEREPVLLEHTLFKIDANHKIQTVQVFKKYGSGSGFLIGLTPNSKLLSIFLSIPGS